MASSCMTLRPGSKVYDGGNINIPVYFEFSLSLSLSLSTPRSFSLGSARSAGNIFCARGHFAPNEGKARIQGYLWEIINVIVSGNTLFKGHPYKTLHRPLPPPGPHVERRPNIRTAQTLALKFCVVVDKSLGNLIYLQVEYLVEKYCE